MALDPLDLNLPDQAPPAKGSMLLDPRALEKWLQALPMANVGETSRQVFKLLVESNRRVLPDATRLRLAALMGQPVRDIVGNLRSYYVDVPLPLSAKRLKVADLCRELYSEMALSYKIVVSDLAGNGVVPVSKKLLAEAIHHVLFYLGRVLLEAAQSYNRLPWEIWRETHQLLALAEAKGIEQLPSPASRRPAGFGPTILEQYKHLLLFGLASPYRLRQKDIRTVYDHLSDWTAQVKLSKPRSFSHQSGLFVIDAEQASPPTHITLFAGDIADHHRILNTRTLVRSLKEQHDQAPEHTGIIGRGRDAGPSRELLRGLIRSWALAPQRRFTRSNIDIELTVVAGLGAIHAAVGTTHSEPTPGSRPKDSMDSSISNWLSPAEMDAYQVETVELSGSVYQSGWGREDDAETPNQGTDDEPAKADWASSKPQHAQSMFTVRTINESANGYLLHWNSEQPSKIKVGELLGIYSVTKADQLGIGIIRWIESRRGEGIHMGVELLAPHAKTVTLQPLDQADARTEIGLLLPETNIPARTQSLIAPPATFKSGSHALISSKTTQRKVRLTRRLDGSAAFVQFQFIQLDAAALGEDADNKDQDDSADFDSLWSVL